MHEERITGRNISVRLNAETLEDMRAESLENSRFSSFPFLYVGTAKPAIRIYWPSMPCMKKYQLSRSCTKQAKTIAIQQLVVKMCSRIFLRAHGCTILHAGLLGINSPHLISIVGLLSDRNGSLHCFSTEWCSSTIRPRLCFFPWCMISDPF